MPRFARPRGRGVACPVIHLCKILASLLHLFFSSLPSLRFAPFSPAPQKKASELGRTLLFIFLIPDHFFFPCWKAPRPSGTACTSAFALPLLLWQAVWDQSLYLFHSFFMFRVCNNVFLELYAHLVEIVVWVPFWGRIAADGGKTDFPTKVVKIFFAF